MIALLLVELLLFANTMIVRRMLVFVAWTTLASTTTALQPVDQDGYYVRKNMIESLLNALNSSSGNKVPEDVQKNLRGILEEVVLDTVSEEEPTERRLRASG